MSGLPSPEIRTGYNASAQIRFTNERLARQLGKFLPPHGSQRFTHNHEIVVSGPRDHAAFYGQKDYQTASGPGFTYILSNENEDARALIAQPIPTWQTACPLRQLLSWIIDRDGGVLLHAAGILCKGTVAVLAGASGSGKSSLAAAYVRHNSDCFLGDDWLPVWRNSRSTWSASALYSSLKITPEIATRLLWADSFEHEHKGKRVYHHRLMPHGTAEVSVVIVPSVAASGIAVRRLTAFEAMQKIAPSTLLQSSGVSRQALTRIKDLCASVPCYAMSVGPDFLESAPAMIRELCP